jgi:hypothetical protein
MTVFAVLMQSPQPRVVEMIKQSFPNDHLQLTDTQYLVSGTGTAIDVSAKLGIYDPKNPSTPATGSAIVFATSSYFGRAATNIWDWIKAKLEASPSG